MKNIETVMFSIELLRNILLLCVGAVLTGIIVPFVKAVIDWHSAKRQKLLEAELARQKEIIDSQIKLLSEFSELVWKMVFEVFKVSYAFAWESKEQQQKTYDNYGPVSWELLTKIRSTISSASRLTSNATHQELKEVYKWLINLDDELSAMADESSIADESRSQEEWVVFHRNKFNEAANKIDSVITKLATDLSLRKAGDVGRQVS